MFFCEVGVEFVEYDLVCCVGSDVDVVDEVGLFVFEVFEVLL